MHAGLRQHLLAAQAQAADVAAQAHEQLSGNGQQQASHNIDPAISGSAPHDAYMHMGDDGGSMSPPSADSKGGRKVLSGTKRAAQNRAAQVSSCIVALFPVRILSIQLSFSTDCKSHSEIQCYVLRNGSGRF